MASTLTQGSRMNGHDNSGNHTAMRTVLSSAPAGGKYGGSKAIEPPAKRLKMSPVLTSPHFDNLSESSSPNCTLPGILGGGTHIFSRRGPEGKGPRG